MSTESAALNKTEELQSTERCTVVVMPRDRFSTTEKSIETIFKNTPEPFDLMVLIGGAPDKLRQRLEKTYGSKAQLIFKPEFLNGSELRNMALKLIKTRLAVFVDSEVFVRPNWLTPLIQCQTETGASMVVPIILDRQNQIHTAGNDFFITQENGRTIGTMELRYANHYVKESTNIPRRETDFGEIHCQLVVVETALKLGVYDERLREHQEMDAGLVWKNAGCIQMCEPKSIVYLHYPELINNVDDIGIFMWKWDLEAMQNSIDYFFDKWKIDINYGNYFIRYFQRVNRRVGMFSRLFPSKVSISIDLLTLKFAKLVSKILKRVINLTPNHP